MNNAKHICSFLLLSFLACKSNSEVPQQPHTVEVRITGTNLRPDWGCRVEVATVTPLPSGGSNVNVRAELTVAVLRDTLFVYRFPNRAWGGADEVQFSLEMSHIVRGGSLQLPTTAFLTGEIMIDGVVKSSGVLNSNSPFPLANPNGGLYTSVREPIKN
jgi:hypothetical protein